MPSTELDTLIAHLKSLDVVTSHDVDPKVLAAGLEDLRNRMGHAEHSHLKAVSKVSALDTRVAEVEKAVAGLTSDRDEFRRQVNTATKLPDENAAKIVELDARVSAVEGAVGAAPYKAPKPVEPEPPLNPFKP